MATYLSLTNEILREMNEVALTSSTFANAIGVQQHVKDVINRAYFDIVNEEPQWPFLATAESGATEEEGDAAPQDSEESKDDSSEQS